MSENQTVIFLAFTAVSVYIVFPYRHRHTHRCHYFLYFGQGNFLGERRIGIDSDSESGSGKMMRSGRIHNIDFMLAKVSRIHTLFVHAQLLKTEG